MNKLDDNREVSVTLTIREWAAVFGAPGDTPKEQKARRKELWPGVIDCNRAALVARHKVKEQLRKEGEL